MHRLDKGWIFSRKSDLLLFGFAVAFAALLGPLGYLFGINEEQPLGLSFNYNGLLVTLRTGILVDFLYHNLIDGPHALATFYRVYLDSEERTRRPCLYWALPLGLFLSLVLIHQISSTGLLRFVAYLNIFHYIRQQYGWVRLSSFKFGPSSTFDSKLDSLTIYAVTLGPLLWWHGHDTDEGWLYKGDLIQFLPTSIADLAFITGTLIFLFYCYRQWSYWNKHQSINWAKNFHIAITYFAWNFGIVFDWGGQQTFMLDMLHTVPYIGLVFFYGFRKFNSDGEVRRIDFSKKGMLLYYVPLVLVTLALFDFSRNLQSDSKWVMSFGMGLILIVPVLHYVLDGFIWKTGKSNPDLSRILNLKK